MLNRKIVLLDGRGAGDEDLNPVLDMLMNELYSTGAAVQTFPLREIKMGSCIGCFGCWLKTPIPFMPFRLWRWLFIKLTNRILRQTAAVNQVGDEERFAQPYAEVGSAIDL